MNVTLILVGLGKILLGVILLGLLLAPVIFIGVATVMILCGKYHVLNAWLKKFGLRGNESAYRQANYYNNGENKAHSIRDFGSKSEVSYSGSSCLSSFSPPSSISNHLSRTNPASGLPMIGSSSIDSGGNVYGTRRL